MSAAIAVTGGGSAAAATPVASTLPESLVELASLGYYSTPQCLLN